MSTLPPNSVPKALYQTALICAAIQFINAIEYMMFNPIFSFMAAHFSVPVSWSGYVTGVYTLASMVAGFCAWFWIDNWNKRALLVASMLSLALMTLLITRSDSFWVLLLLRFCAGVVGGICMGVANAVLINHTPEPLRPRMLALVIASFSLVSIIGMPVILFICERVGWPVALWLIGGLCLITLPFILYGLPSDTGHQPAVKKRNVLGGRLLCYASAGALTQFSPMLIIPVLVPILVTKLHVQPSMLPVIFLVGGITGLIATKLSGKLLSQLSGAQVSLVSTALFIISLLLIATGSESGFWFISLFLGASYGRLVAASAVVVNYPDNRTRTSFNMLQTALMSLSTAIAFFLSSWMLRDEVISDEALNQVLWLAGISAVLLPYCLQRLARSLALRAQAKTWENDGQKD